ncbi:hypothetical protein NQ314_013457 [Rhamnusium bicolor]|uniref:NADH dehydrogenase [ubiquinone] 1 beta subcomplex subunit 5, mitochondrial n=1 Tax=Rhamnusium bicolor TaxID=1586634 RepID=A0AAV8X6T6_9CUCU|nr:hypothetical protein NQ314_013457 [Rhamnusium bicolor]
MVVFSSLRSFLRLPSNTIKNAVVSRAMSDHRSFTLAPSRWEWNKFKDLVHFYILLGVIPCSSVILYANIFIGPATLSEIPEGYVPKYWEYYRYTPMLAGWRAVAANAPLKFPGDLKVTIALENQIKAKLAERSDYKAYYYRPVLAKYHRVSREAAEYLETIRGD